MGTFTRRTLLGFGAGLAAAPLRAAPARDVTVPLWPGEPPGGGGPAGPTVSNRHGAIRDIARPTLTVVRPERPTGGGMLVAGGGGYRHIEMETEAFPAARWLAARGITAYILAYRLPPEGWSAGPLAPLQDAQRALRLIRAGVAGHNAGRDRLGVLGFSAGGHLMGMAAVRPDFQSYEPVDAADRLSARPDGAALIYPVITLQPPFDHTVTRRSLIGRHPTPEASAAWSVETHVRTSCPPMFLVQAEDDPVSPPANTLLMVEACRRAGVPVETHRLPSGGHGFGMGRPGTPTAEWPGWYEAWLRDQGFLA